MFRYTYPAKAVVKPYINAGIGNGFVVKTNENKSKRTDYDWEEAIDGPRKYEQTLIGGIGVKVRKVNAEVRYTSGNGFSPYGGTKSVINSFQILAGYSF